MQTTMQYTNDQEHKLEWVATKLSQTYAIHPKGCIGTCGRENGIPWTIKYSKRLPPGIKIED